MKLCGIYYIKNLETNKYYIGSSVNIEVDMLARYIANYLNNKQKTSGEKDRILKEKLEKYGFI